ncbi:transcription factor Rap1, putative [Cordyceps militaris CM01]|uniref:DNA-binding protein RAP1 n=1 Tax=Cordyceps militaris (strain CM01) TaxID=983644 RepID=G3JDL3_CORMM|nr:transcription factor Rap1, putative [Cordyceps militaris CM01]EGX92688.1 transcription factor Rap1, putative [Cordyceps militaris CM01]
MAGGITYDGVPVENGGQIFDGLKFWVAQRVPTRSAILDHIQRNSGIIVPLEKNADYLIADHARKDAPAGSISWKFITESVENGVAQLPDHYRIGLAPAVTRGAASSKPNKTIRTPFTAAEDAALASWVLASKDSRMGNEMYKQFGAKKNQHPSHPWSSWRDRFVKKLMLLPPESLHQLAAQAADRATPQPNQEVEEDDHFPDPTELMLQRKGERVQQEAARQRAEGEAIQPPPAATPSLAPSPLPQAAEREDAAGTQAIERENFYDDLQTFAEVKHININPTQEVAGQCVELWKLARAISQQKLPADDIDWFRIAQELGYAGTDADAAVPALQQCYELNLAEFLDLQEALFEDGEDSPPQPSSPLPCFLPAKRPLDADGELEIQTPAKRRRLQIPREVPSTPEVNRRQQPTPSTIRPHAAATTTPVRSARREPSPDITSSQQLQSEHLHSSPLIRAIPLHLNSAAQNRQPGRSSTASSSRTTKKRVLPGAFKPSALPPPPSPPPPSPPPPIDDDAPFPLAMPREQPPPSRRRPAQRATTTTAAPRRLSKERELSDLIQHYESLGYAHETVVEGLRRTTMTPGLAAEVMQSLRDGRGVPAHHEGIWTDVDDAGLRLVVGAGPDLDQEDGEVVRSKAAMKAVRKARRTRDRLLNKHGRERMALRVKYLRASDNLAAAAREQSV